MDVIYQLIVLKIFYPGEAVIVAIGLAFFPYLLLRGPIERIISVYTAVVYWMFRGKQRKGYTPASAPPSTVKRS